MAAPAERRLLETFGWEASAWLFGGLLCAVGTALLTGRAGAPDSLGPKVLYGVGVFLSVAAPIAFEIVRRRSRRALLVLDDRVGVYRKGRLERVIPREHVQIYRLLGVVTYRKMLGYFMLAFVGMCAAPFGLMDSEVRGGGLIAVGLLAGALGGLASSNYTRAKCRSFNVMTARGVERILFRLKDLHEVALTVRWFTVD